MSDLSQGERDEAMALLIAWRDGFPYVHRRARVEALLDRLAERGPMGSESSRSPEAVEGDGKTESIHHSPEALERRIAAVSKVLYECFGHGEDGGGYRQGEWEAEAEAILASLDVTSEKEKQ